MGTSQNANVVDIQLSEEFVSTFEKKNYEKL